MLCPNRACRRPMVRISGEGRPLAFQCLHCGQEFHPLRLSEADVRKIIAIEEKHDREAARRVWVTRERDWR